MSEKRGESKRPEKGGRPMRYRRLGRTGLEVGEVSLGTEYLIDLPRAHVVSVIREAVARGVNYFDLFYAQPQFRDNMGEAFADVRRRVILAAHLGAAERDGQYEKTRDLETAERLFHDFLARYRTDHVDVLFLHNVDDDEDYKRVMGTGGLLEMARRFRGQGKARFIGFSGHTVATARKAVESGSIDVLMFTINMSGNAIPGKRELFKACVSRDIGLVAMKPFAGGKLLQGDGEMSLENWLVGGGERRLEKRFPITPVQCISYALSQIGVSTVVPGCRDLEQLAASLVYETASDGQKDYSPVITGFREYVSGECVYCNHCLPCPSRINIGRVVRMLEAASRPPAAEQLAAYRELGASAADCIRCGQCATRCPFGVDVIAKMDQAAALFG